MFNVIVFVICSADTAKYTTISNVIYKCACIDKSTINKYKRNIRKWGKTTAKNSVAGLLNEVKAEREDGFLFEIELYKMEMKIEVLYIAFTPPCWCVNFVSFSHHHGGQNDHKCS